MLRKTIFWTHLVCGVTTGLVILMMSVTGVILTYERQMLSWAEPDLQQRPEAGTVRQPIEALVAGVTAAEPDFNASSVTLSSDPLAPVSVSAGRSGARLVDPYTGEVLGSRDTSLSRFFSAVTGWHRWFNAGGDSRGVWRAITGASNLAFLFLILSGIYLWLPRVFKWALFKARLVFNAKATTPKARDLNWHQVFGFWTAIPLAVVVATATVFSYPWANNLLYRSFGEKPPQRRGPPPAASVQRPQGTAVGAASGTVSGAPAVARQSNAPPQRQRSLDELFVIVAEQADDWEQISVQLPGVDDRQVHFSIDRGNGGQPQLRNSLVLDAHTGAVSSYEPFGSQTPARQARSWVRFLHTGEALGLIGQTVAGIVSLTSVIMVWTGLALAYRRLISPLFRRRTP